MLINNERSRNVYENKQKDDNLPTINDDIFAQRYDISYKHTRILRESWALLSLFERWGTNPSLQNAETRVTGKMPVPPLGSAAALWPRKRHRSQFSEGN
jgi:hypothetical protein